MTILDQVSNATDYIQSLIDFTPKAAVILGTGLSDFADTIQIIKSVPYSDIPHFPKSTVKTHKGRLVFGRVNGADIVVMQGRFHYYEGYEMAELTLPIRVLHRLGVDTLIITNIAGGLNIDYKLGDLVLVTDHINLHASNPLRGLTDEAYGPRFPVMLDVYDKDLRNQAHLIAGKHDLTLKEGVYVSLQGPSLETRAEYKFLKIIGGDLVGMSTVPEVIVARQLDLSVCVLSCVSNLASDPDHIEHAELDEIIAVAKSAGEKLRLIINGLLSPDQLA